MGISILEAMACGLVVISSGTGGSAELFVDGESGMVFKARDANDLSWKLGILLRNPERIREIASRALENCTVNNQFLASCSIMHNNLF